MLRFPFLFGGTFIEGEGTREGKTQAQFPFLFGGTFIEGKNGAGFYVHGGRKFPFLFGGTFIEGRIRCTPQRV